MQRRGAIIILGMLAVAKRDVVTERVETLLNVGLGPLGQVSSGRGVDFARHAETRTRHDQADLQLARYTCVALQRLSGSTKKVKGGCGSAGSAMQAS